MTILRRVVHAVAPTVMACVLVVQPAAAAEGAIQIRDLDLEGSPRVHATVSVATVGEISAADIEITENGAVPDDLEVTPLVETGGEIEIVLAIDTSGSMRGAPMAAAKRAALTFIRDLPQEIRIGVLNFSSRPRTALRITEDHAAALGVVKRLDATGETAIYDAVLAASRMFERHAQRNIVLLSDGGDTSSGTSLKQAIGAAQRRDAAVFTIGLKTPETDLKVLRRIAQETGGRYQTADAVDLSDTYRDLATVLANQYSVSYTSAADPASHVRMVATIPGGSDEVLFLSPARAEDAKPAPKAVVATPSQALLRDGWGIAVALSLSFLALFCLFFMLIGRQARVNKDRRLAKRLLAKRPDDEERPDEEKNTLTSWIPRSVTDAADRYATARGSKEKLDRKLERAGMAVKPGEFLALTICCGLAGSVVGLIAVGGPAAALAGGCIGAVAVHLWVSRRIGGRKKQLQMQLPDVLMVLASSLRAGHSFLQALDEVANEISEPVASEFKRAVTEIRLGRAVDEALNDLAERIDSEDFRWAVLAVDIQREVGGNMAEVLDTVATTLREREYVKRQVAVLSAEGRISAWVLCSLPVLLGAYMAAARPEAFGLMFTTGLGIAMLVGAVTLMGIGVLWIRKTVRIDV